MIFFLQFKMKSFLFIVSVHFVLSREMCREIKSCRPVKQYLHLRKVEVGSRSRYISLYKMMGYFLRAIFSFTKSLCQQSSAN